tara:strand:+ start:7512 stop:7859 length:348 start_codon:yes stop_codon:yes gene_type:complete
MENNKIYNNKKVLVISCIPALAMSSVLYKFFVFPFVWGLSYSVYWVSELYMFLLLPLLPIFFVFLIAKSKWFRVFSNNDHSGHKVISLVTLPTVSSILSFLVMMLGVYIIDVVFS